MLQAGGYEGEVGVEVLAELIGGDHLLPFAGVVADVEGGVVVTEVLFEKLVLLLVAYSEAELVLEIEGHFLPNIPAPERFVHAPINVVVGAGSVVTKDLAPRKVYAGNPARFIRNIDLISLSEKKKKLDEIISKYVTIAEYHGIRPKIITDYPVVKVNNCKFDVETFTVEGNEDEETDDFRDYIRRWGLRFYTDRPLKSVERRIE